MNRQDEIMKLLETRGSIAIAELAVAMDVSLETVRRDVKPLQAAGALIRMHGAVALAGQTGEAPFQKRMGEGAEAKRAIARSLAATIRDGDAVMLDTGTTTSYLARALMGHRRLVVVTNSSDIARTLATVNGNRVYMAGGELRPDNGAAFGPSALEFIARFFVAHSVISAGAVDASGVMDFDLDEAEFARAVLSRGERRVVVTDHSKFGRRGLISVCGFDGVTDLITDAAPSSAISEALQAAGTKLTVAGDTRR
ncbi:MAG: DeoR/GlpR family DNA-binding transcription regulator [Albidovulum sp.]